MTVPLYQQIKAALAEDIQGQRPNTPIKSERELSVIYKASRMTVRRAVDALVDEGVLYRDSNRGTFVADRSLIKKHPAQDILEKEGQEGTVIYFAVKPGDRLISPHLGIQEHEDIIRIVRLNRIAGRPASIEEIYYVWDMIGSGDAEDIDRLLDLKRFAADGSIRQRFVPVTVPVKYVNFLELELNQPIIMVESTIFNKTGKPLIYIREYNNPNEKEIEIIS